jgi:dTDP-4-amino-4,6-dideoxygalactose transaminase
MIPFVDLKAQYLSIKEDIDNAISKVIDNTSFIGGEEIGEFEKEFANFLGVKYVNGCANGTDSIEIILKSLNIGMGDEVIVPAMSWISTSEAVSSVGAKPVFVDIEEEYFTINPELIEEKITVNTKAIIPVHLYGQPCNMERIVEIAKKFNLFIIEDVAQAHNSNFKGRLTGTFGDAASFSFYPGKNLGAYGDAGGIATNSEEIASKTKMIAQHGQIKKHTHIIEGRNSRLDTIQASILLAKLPYLEKWTQARVNNAVKYSEMLSEVDEIILPKVRKNSRHVFHLYVIRTERREELQQYLNDEGIQTSIHYPKSLPFLDCYKPNNYSELDFPVSAKIQSEILSIPMYPELTDQQLSTICCSIKAFFND